VDQAIVTDHLILADEPTGSLDSVSATEGLSQLSKLSREFRETIVMVAHGARAASFASRRLHLEKGELLASSY
jgi:putative ABC transport system ATP-binding protein